MIEIKIPLKSGKYYSLHDLLKESNSKLSTTYDLKTVPDRQYELTDRDKRLLSLASLAGWMQFRHSKTTIVLAFPNPENKENRKQIRAFFSRWLKNDGYKKSKLIAPAHLRPTAQTVLLIHGLESNAKSMDEIRTKFIKQKRQVFQFEYPNDGPIADSGEQLSKALKKISKKHPRLRFAIIAHSMGGLVARYCLETPGLHSECVTDLITLGTPHQGSHLARGQIGMEMILQTIPNVAKGNLFSSFRDGLGEASEDLLPGSQFLRELNNRKRPRNVSYHTAAGNKGFVSKSEHEDISKKIYLEMKKRNVSILTSAKNIGFLKKTKQELQSGTGDGAVSLTSAHLKNVKNQKTFYRNHLEFLSLNMKKGPEDEVFVWMMEVLGWQMRKE